MNSLCSCRRSLRLAPTTYYVAFDLFLTNGHPRGVTFSPRSATKIPEVRVVVRVARHLPWCVIKGREPI